MGAAGSEFEADISYPFLNQLLPLHADVQRMPPAGAMRSTSRSGSARHAAQETVEVPGASHALPASQPDVVADFILRAAASV